MPARHNLSQGTIIDLGTATPVASISVMTLEVPTGTVAIFNVGGRIYAIDNGCVRCGASLAEGSLVETTITCPNCDWRYDVRTGCVEGIPSLRTDTYEVKVVGSRLLVAPRRD